jgi:peptidoglycan/LPS O-acetylase OafA/YrhL
MATLAFGARTEAEGLAAGGHPIGARDGGRLVWIDAVRGLLALLVVAHHAGQPYGLGGDWPVLEAARDPALGAFFTVNASFFMGLFFLLSGYFLPGGYDRKGAAAFLRERALRLGAPLLFFGLAFFGPITFLEYRDEGGRRPFWEFLVRDYLGQWEVQLGHLWFLAHLLVYAVAYAAWRYLAGRRPGSVGTNRPVPGHRVLLLYALALAAVTYVVRVRFPIDRWERLLGVVPAEVAHLPQYASLVVVGVLAARGDWLRRFPTPSGMAWLRVGLAAATVAYVYALPFGDRLPPIFAEGGPGWPALARSLWEALLCVGLCVGLLVLARERSKRPGRVWRTLAANAYGVYVMHVWVVVALQFALVDVALPPLAKFALVSLAGIPLSVAVAALVRRLPGARHVL